MADVFAQRRHAASERVADLVQQLNHHRQRVDVEGLRDQSLRVLIGRLIAEGRVSQEEALAITTEWQADYLNHELQRICTTPQKARG